MKMIREKTYFSATDLSLHIPCSHSTFVNIQEGKGKAKSTVIGNGALYKFN